jgi:MFS family permease
MNRAAKPISPRRLLIPLSFGVICSLLGDSTLYTVLPNPVIAAQAGVTLATVGVVLGLNRAVRLVFNTPAGFIYDRLPRRPVMLASITIGTISTLLYVLADGPTLLLIGRAMWGLAWSGIWVGASTMALDISDDHNRGRINGGLQTGFLLGVALAGVSGGIFTDLFGYRGGLLVSASASAVGALVWVFFLPETRPAVPDKATQEESEADETPASEPFPWRMILAAAVPMFANRISFAGVLMATTILWMAQFAADGLTLGSMLLPLATLSGLFVGLRVLLATAGAPLLGVISDRIGKRWIVIASTLAIMGLGVTLMSLPLLGIALAGAFLAVSLSGGIPTLSAAVVGDSCTPAQQGRAISMTLTVADLGSAIGPPLALTLVPLIGIGTVYRGTGVVFALSALFAFWMASREPRRSQTT